MTKLGSINNPLTLIAFFASLAEGSGFAVVRYLSPDNQTFYMWFLIIFAFVVMIGFFLTLNFNHVVLYPPNQYRDDKSFLAGVFKDSNAVENFVTGVALKEIEPAEELNETGEYTFIFSNDEENVLMALDNTKYSWRTANGIADDTKIAKEKILNILNKFIADDIIIMLDNIHIDAIAMQRWALTYKGRRAVNIVRK